MSTVREDDPPENISGPEAGESLLSLRALVLLLVSVGVAVAVHLATGEVPEAVIVGITVLAGLAKIVR